MVLPGVRAAIRRYGKPEIINTDQGALFTSDEWIECVVSRNITISIDGRNRAIDNVFIERLRRSLKYEYVYLHPPFDSIELFNGVDSYINYYYMERCHSALDNLTPFEVFQEKMTYQQKEKSSKKEKSYITY